MTREDKARKMGILLTDEKTFYWLETGNVNVGNEVERIRSRLMSRNVNLFPAVPTAAGLPPTHQMISLLEAENAGYKTEIMYLNSHIKSVVTQTKSEQDTSAW